MIPARAEATFSSALAIPLIILSAHAGRVSITLSNIGYRFCD